MKVRFLDSVVGERFSYAPGQVVDLLDQREALGFIRGGVAAAVREPAIETAEVRAPEAAVTRRRRGKNAGNETGTLLAG